MILFQISFFDAVKHEEI